MHAFWGWTFGLGLCLVLGSGFYLFMPHRNFGWQVDGKKPWADARSSGRNRIGDWQFQSTRTNFGIPHGSMEITHPAGIRRPALESSVALEVRVPEGEKLFLQIDQISLTYQGHSGGNMMKPGEATVSFFGEGPFTWNGRPYGPGHHRGPLVLPLTVEIPKGNRSIALYLPVHLEADVRKQKNLTEVLHLSARADGKMVMLAESFELGYVPHYNEFEVLMGI